MKQYLDLVKKVMTDGMPRPTRTGERTIGIFADQLAFDLGAGFPLISTKEMNFKAIAAELLGFLHGATSAAEFRAFGTKIWDANANAIGDVKHPNAWLSNPNRKGDDDLGRIYGAQWRDWTHTSIKPFNAATTQGDYPIGQMLYGTISASKKNDVYQKRVDQIANLVKGLREDPFGRRHLVSAWNPGELDQMALPPCHVMFQCYVSADESGEPERLHMQMYQRSVDVFLGLPFNIASYALLTHILAHITGLKVGTLTMALGDIHIYESHLPEMLVQLRRKPDARLPALEIGRTVQEELPKGDVRRALHGQTHEDVFYADTGAAKWDGEKLVGDRLTEIEHFTSVKNFNLRGYNPHGPLRGKMAV